MFNYAKLEACIKQSGKTKTYLCKQLGRPPYYLRDVLRQKNIIPEEYQAILADELGVTVAFLNDAETESNSHKAQKNIPTPEGEEFVDEGMEFVELPYESQEALYALFSDACQKASIPEGYAVVRAGLNKDIMLRLRTSSYSMASVAYIRALASYLSVLDEANAILAKAPELVGAKLEIARQMMEQAMRLNLSKFK